ncbi:TonB-dependent receptor [Phenylobacterium aquaticum]|uniref:TonB-dependent receptor n=1 Tax=Phenylobacterium aquaticum TaxID=1763816 RepID=UPI001F5CFEAE|nr:TonB-dependent receptor [Phenylobacterium aquaticum]MCI3133220.1 TonB-dependent receptor [Phenylobacterium aquaticum]
MTYMKRLAGGAALTALVCAMSSAMYAQETTSAVHGEITANGAPVDKASVTVVHTPSGTRAVTAVDAGAFDLRGLRVGGPYTVTVTAQGFPTKVYKNVFLQVGQTLKLNVDLAEVEEFVVTGSGNRNSDQGPKTVLDQNAIKTIVTINRDPRDLARRDMLVAQDLSGGRAGTNSGGVSIAGSNPRYNRIAVDGVAAQDNFGLAQGGLTTARGPVTLDAVEQFSVAAAPTDVQNGDFVGGALNLVLRSGGNEFHGVVFDNYLNDGLVGKKTEDARIKQAISQKNYGAFLSGPIIKDRLFFALSYENYETIDATLFGVPGSGAGTAFANGLTQSQIDNVVNIYNTKYASKFTLGSVSPVKPVTDKKYSAKIDWNITDAHRASFTYRYAESSSIQRTDLSATTASLDSHWYTQFNSDEAYTFELNSHWTDRLSTFVKATYRDYNNQQLPPSGQNYSDVRVCLAPTSDATLTSCAAGFDTVRWGPDQFRHANALREQEYRYQAQAEYALDDNVFKVGVQARQAKPYDIFVPNSRGQYYFDSVADFQAGKASELIYSNAISGNPNDAAYNSPYWTFSLYGQDTLRITENLKVAAGVRIDRYEESDKPILNPNFVNRNGYTNQKTIDGLQIVMPRVSAEWTPTTNLRFNAGLGLFSGGTPDVLTGAPFYNTGYATTGIDIQRTATGFNETTGTGGFTQAIGSTALDNLFSDPNFGYQIQAQVKALQQGTLTGTPTIPSTGEVIALAPSFQLPSQWKLFLSGNWRFGDGWAVQGDFVAVEVNHEITYYDAKAQPLMVNGVQQFLPDGRIRYDGLGTVAGKSSTNLGSNRDIIVDNTNKGHSYTASVALSKSWDWGGDLLVGYAHQEMKDTGGGVFFGTTAGSLYAGVMSGNDPNRDYLGRSVYEIPNRYKIEFGYHHAFFGDNETRISLFAERQDGRPFGFAMQDRASGRGPVFGVNRQSELLYVPDFKGDTNPADLNVGLVTFATQADYDNFKRYVTNFKLPNNQLVQKYSNDNAPIGRLDMQLSQELPSPIQGHKFKVNLDVRNVLNLLNNSWGRVAEYSDITTLARVDCADANGAAVPTTSAACPRYRYSQVPTSVSKTTNTPLSLWYVQVGLRYEF